MTSSTPEARVLGDFVLGERLGEGGFGTVYRAHQKSLDRPAVVKTIRASLAHRQDSHARFVQEARLASRFDHPFAAHVYAFGSEPDGLLWIAMELVRGTPLDVLIARSGPLPLERFVPLMDRLCDVIQAAHDQGIVHRDIKPSNVMIISRGGRLLPKLLDFGIAKAVRADLAPARAHDPIATKRDVIESGGFDGTVQADASDAATGELTHAGQILGSPLYMAPEQWLDASRVGPRTDQYALAILAYEVLTGKRPYDATSVSELVEAHVHEPLPALPETLPTGLDVVLARAAAKDPLARFADLGELATALHAAANVPAELEERIELPPVLATWTFDAPSPIADAIALLTAARTAVRVSDRTREVGRALAHWLGVVALACRSRLGRTSDHDDLALVRELRQRALDPEDWLELAIATTRAFVDRAEAFPTPELVRFLVGDALPVLRALVRGETGLVVVAADGSLERQTASARVAQLGQVLEAASWLLDFSIARATEHGFELWMGQTGDERVVRMGRSGELLGAVTLLDADGAPVAILSPLVTLVRPAHADREHVFVLAGPGRTPDHARAIALPRGYEHEIDGVWPWLAANVLELDGDAATFDDQERPPYPGLAAFTSADRDSFVGREREVDDVVNRLREHSLVTLAGPSGAGKSSFLAAGVVPALPGTWRAEIVRPGDAPLQVLAALAHGRHHAAYRGPVPGSPPRELDDIVAGLVAREEPLVIVVDQAEELFTMCHDEAQRVAFAEVIVRAVREPRIRCVLGVRDDFLYRLDELAAWRGFLARDLHILRAPTANQLERIVIEPMRRRGYTFDDDNLAREIAAELADRPGALSLVAFAAASLWEQRDRHFKRITRTAYTQIGGVGGALVAYADGVVDALSAADRRLVRLAFHRLVSIEGTRVAMSRAELIAALGGEAAATRVVERLLSSRLIVVRDDDAGERVQIVHEVLTTAWPRLAAWRSEANADLEHHRALTAAARAWDDRGRPHDLLWRGDVLAELRRWRARTELALGTAEAAFADASERAHVRTRRRRVAVLAGAFTVLATAVVLLLGLNRTVSRQRADAVRRLAASLEDHGRLAMADDPGRALVYLVGARKLGAEGATIDLLTARATAALESERQLVAHQSEAYLQMRSDATTAVTRTSSGAQIWDRASGTQLASPIAGAYDAVPLGNRIASVTLAGVVQVTDRDGTSRWTKSFAVADDPMIIIAIDGTAAADVVAVVHDRVRLFRGHDGSELGELTTGAPATAVAFDPTGARIAIGDQGGTIVIVDVTTKARVACSGHAGAIQTLAFSTDGAWLASGGADHLVGLCDTSAGGAIKRLEGHSGGIERVEVSPDRRFVASASRDGSARIWNVATGALEGVLAGHHGSVRSARFSPDGRSIATAGSDGTARIWEVPTGVQTALVQGGAAITAVEWEPGGRTLFTSSHDGTLRRWDVVHASRGVASKQHEHAVVDLGISADGRWSATAGDGPVVLWDLRTDGAFTHVPVEATTLALAPSSSDLAVIDGKGDVSVWTTSGSLERRVPATHASATAMTSDATVTTTSTGTLQVWDAGGHERARIELGFAPEGLDVVGELVVVRPACGDTRAPGLAVIDPRAGKRVAALHAKADAACRYAATTTQLAQCDGDDIQIWDARTWQPLRRLHGHRSTCFALAYLPDGRLVSAGNDRTTRVWSASGEPLATLATTGSNALAIATSKDVFATGALDGALRLWDATSYRLLETAPVSGEPIRVLAFTPDGGSVLAMGFGGRIVRWDTRHPRRSLADLERLARCRVPLVLDGDAIVPRELDYDDPACR